MSTANDICNMALDVLKEAPLTDYTTDNTSVSRWFVRNYATFRDAELEAHPWRFAMTRATASADAAAPTFGWKYKYAKPAGLLRIVQMNSSGYFEYDPIPHELEGDWILTDQSSTIYLVYVQQITDPTKHTNLFNQALAAAMARALSHWLTGKANMVAIADAAYKEALARARRANALFSTPERAFDSDVINARYCS